MILLFKKYVVSRNVHLSRSRFSMRLGECLGKSILERLFGHSEYLPRCGDCKGLDDSSKVKEGLLNNNFMTTTYAISHNSFWILNSPFSVSSRLDIAIFHIFSTRNETYFLSLSELTTLSSFKEVSNRDKIRIQMRNMRQRSFF